MTNKRERRKWALDMAAALLNSDMDTFDPDEFEDDDEKDKRRAAIRRVADELQWKAERIKVGEQAEKKN